VAPLSARARIPVSALWNVGLCGGRLEGPQLGSMARARESAADARFVRRTHGHRIKEACMTKRRWSQRVTERSDALDLDRGVFTRSDPRSIARSLKRSADRSRRRKADPYRSAMSMLTFYINRAGKSLSATQKRRLEATKDELRRLYRRPARTRRARGSKGPARTKAAAK
jgi:hypothetical protein